MSELDEEVVVESSVGSSCLRVISVRVVVVLLSRGRLVQMGFFREGRKMFQFQRNWKYCYVFLSAIEF